jgi:hypothetical protein
MKRFGICIAVLVATVTLLSAQDSKGSAASGEKTVEEAYLTQTYEGKMILQFASADTKGRKQDALVFIKEALDAGRKNDDIYKALSQLSLDGTINTVREGGIGRVLNNYPDVRTEACTYLGVLGTEAAKQALIKVVYADNEPMVITEAIKSLGIIGDNKDGRASQAISSIVNKYDVLDLPDNRLALAALVSIEQLADKNGGMDSSSLEVVMLMAEGNKYITPVKSKAQEIIKKLTKFSGNSNASSKK